MLELYRYIEFNPDRAKIVTDPSEHRWSSYQTNAFGNDSDLWSSHPEYFALGSDSKKRREIYRMLFVRHFDGKLLEEIRANTNKGLAFENIYTCLSWHVCRTSDTSFHSRIHT